MLFAADWMAWHFSFQWCVTQLPLTFGTLVSNQSPENWRPIKVRVIPYTVTAFTFTELDRH
jgi:hypothetical protein